MAGGVTPGCRIHAGPKPGLSHSHRQHLTCALHPEMLRTTLIVQPLLKSPSVPPVSLRVLVGWHVECLHTQDLS